MRYDERVRKRSDEDRPLDAAIGERLARLRSKREMTQVELAKALGVSQAMLSRYEKGEVRLTAPAVVKIAKALKVSTDELLGVKKS